MTRQRQPSTAATISHHTSSSTTIRSRVHRPTTSDSPSRSARCSASIRMVSVLILIVAEQLAATGEEGVPPKKVVKIIARWPAGAALRNTTGVFALADPARPLRLFCDEPSPRRLLSRPSPTGCPPIHQPQDARIRRGNASTGDLRRGPTARKPAGQRGSRNDHHALRKTGTARPSRPAAADRCELR